ncbi:RNA polymerase sigma factor [Nitrosomonas sp.]|uniref:RNA polymerase sigma factor n=1 Tax=Nitrosomonas sp. TaxID=42353 RepID=UPI00207DDC3E|nr:RNA polymerase sigma factor [Nitrosomonas sp.]GJL76493.1 MAG: ECF sigma factor [Nitrosomonas sp.]
MNPSLLLTNIYLRHVSELRAFLFRRVRCREVAAELTQETFIRIMMGCQTDNPIHNIRAMLYRIAGNLAIDYHRMQVKHSKHVSIDELPEHEQPLTDVSDPARITSARQTLEKLCAIIEALPPQCHRAFVLHKFDGYSHAQIAAKLGISRNAVEKLLIRALVRLRQVLL